MPGSDGVCEGCGIIVFGDFEFFGAEDSAGSGDGAHIECSGGGQAGEEPFFGDTRLAFCLFALGYYLPDWSCHLEVWIEVGEDL